MKLCLMCDLHLPTDISALPYRVLDFALASAKEENADAIIFVGDVTCDGNNESFDRFLRKAQNTGLPLLYIPGNSDLRSSDTREELMHKASPICNLVGDTRIIAVNDCTQTIAEEAFAALQTADEHTVVFLHHPIECLSEASKEKMTAWAQVHPETMLFYAHNHQWHVHNHLVSLPALDPDKNIGEPPCVVFYDTKDKSFSKKHFPCPMPKSLYHHLGVSCYRPAMQIPFAIAQGLKNIELRPEAVDLGDALVPLVESWRKSGGENLSVHLPEIGFQNGKPMPDPRLPSIVALAEKLHADRFTQHVPLVSVAQIKSNPDALPSMASCLAKHLNTISHPITLGVENMHMTAKESADDSRRFGYTPDECLLFMNELQKTCRFPVGINFDIGHARNNAPFSQCYQISHWLSLVGKHIVGYHIHQVRLTEQGFQNHAPITDVYGALISFSSVFHLWQSGEINHAPFVFEMPDEDAYPISLQAFRSCL